MFSANADGLSEKTFFWNPFREPKYSSRNANSWGSEACSRSLNRALGGNGRFLPYRNRALEVVLGFCL